MIIWIASYPKSGNTWVRTFISTYYFSTENKFNFKFLKYIRQFPHEKFFGNKIHNINSAIENWDNAQKEINKDGNTKFLKTHSALAKINNFPFTSKQNTIASIYIVRDPRNIITSISNHYSLDFDEAIKFMTNKKKFLINNQDINNFGNFTFLNSWAEHYKSWLNNKEFETLCIKYEDLQANSIVYFKQIIQFINRVLKRNEEIDEERVKEIVKSISFDVLSKKEQNEGFPEAVKIDGNKRKKFFYLGKKNNWRKIFNSRQIEILDETFREDLNKLNY